MRIWYNEITKSCQAAALQKGVFSMGLIKAGIGALGGTLADQWKEFFYCDALDNNVLMATSDDGISWEIWKGEDGGKEPYPVIRMTDEQMADSWDKSQLAGGSGYGRGRPGAY